MIEHLINRVLCECKGDLGPATLGGLSFSGIRIFSVIRWSELGFWSLDVDISAIGSLRGTLAIKQVMVACDDLHTTLEIWRPHPFELKSPAESPEFNAFVRGRNAANEHISDLEIVCLGNLQTLFRIPLPDLNIEAEQRKLVRAIRSGLPRFLVEAQTDYLELVSIAMLTQPAFPVTQ